MIIQLKAVEKTQRERLHVAYVTSHFSTHSAKTKALHMSRFVVVFTSIKAFVLSLKEGGKVHQRHSHVPTAGSVCEWW